MKKSYRELQTELDTLLEQLQASDLDIDQALRLYKEGQKLVSQLEERLETAKNEIQELKQT